MASRETDKNFFKNKKKNNFNHRREKPNSSED